MVKENIKTIAGFKTLMIPLTIIMVQDPKSKGYTIYTKEYPYIIAEGDNKRLAMANLFETMSIAFRYKKDIDV